MKKIVVVSTILLSPIILLIEISIIAIIKDLVCGLYEVFVYRTPRWDLVLGDSFSLLISTVAAIGIPVGIYYIIPKIKNMR